MDNNFDYLSDENLVTIIIVYHYQNNEEYQQSLLNELKRRNIDINQFDNNESYIKSFISSFPDGWSSEIQIMFDELLSLGWNKSMHLQAKEKWGYFNFSGANLSDELCNVIKKHAELINETCSRCGSKDHVQTTGWWVELLCRKCSHLDYKAKGIYNISAAGFDYQNHHSTNIHFLWEEITEIKFTFTDDNQSISMETNRIIGEPYNISESLEFQIFNNLNFLKLLINIPNSLLNDFETQKRNDFLHSLKECYFCDKKTLYLKNCLLCKESLSQVLSSKNNRYMKFFNNIAFAIDVQREETRRFIEYSNDSNFFYNNDYFL